MPEVPMIATKAFTYRTRRLIADDEFQARNPLEARILNRVRKVADYPTAKVAAPKAVAPAPVKEAAPKPAAKKAPAKRKAKAKK